MGKSLSDLGGTDEHVHGGTAHGLFGALTNALARSRHRPTVAELEQIYADLLKAAAAIKRSRPSLQGAGRGGPHQRPAEDRVYPTAARIFACSAPSASIIASTDRAPAWKSAVALSATPWKPIACSSTTRATTRSGSA